MRQAIRRDAYEIIGVDPDASELEIKRAFRERAKKMHPDANGGGERQDEFLRLVEAYRETEVGRKPDQIFVEPPQPPKTLLQKLFEKKWWILTCSALAVALYIRSLPPADEPVLHDEPVQSEAAAHFQQTRRQDALTAEPVWADERPSRGQVIESFSRQLTHPIDLPSGKVQLPDALRPPPPELRGTVTTERASENQVTGSLSSSAPAGSGATEMMQPPAFVSVMPPRRPKHIGEAKKYHAPAKKQQGEPEQPPPPSATPAKSDPSILGQLGGLLGLK